MKDDLAVRGNWDQVDEGGREKEKMDKEDCF